jgi:hypothetical protein
MNLKFSNLMQHISKFSVLLLYSEKATNGGNHQLTESMLWTNVQTSSVLKSGASRVLMGQSAK